jgi:hypothetical protein
MMLFCFKARGPRTENAGSAAATMRAALGQSLHLTFWGVFLIATTTLLLATLVPSVALTEGPRTVVAE